MRRRLAPVSLMLCTTALVLVSSFADAARAATPEDPWEGFNRSNYEAHDTLDKAIIRPLARLYHALTPGIIGKGIHNILINMSEPVTFANDALQLRPKRAFRTSARFVANTLAGFGGIMDVAGYAGMPHKDNDFGVTMGVWGLKSGPYIFAPLVGPTTVRDLTGSIIEAVLDPMRFASFDSRTPVDISLAVVGGLDKRYQNAEDLDTLLRDSTDPYATLRSAYLQDREANVEDREAPPVNLPDIDSAPPASTESAPPAEAAPEAPPAAQPAAEPAPAPQAQAVPQAALDPDAPMITAGADAAHRDAPVWREASL